VSERSRPSTDWLLLIGFSAYLFFFGSNYFGLLGADEPRYAQIAREMLVRHDWITPVLGGRPWLEKPPFYYWQAMLSYSVFGVTDWAARIPAALDATLMVIAVYLFLRRLRPGYELDGALMTAASAGIIGFAHAASTDMPLAATFSIALLSWYAWQEFGTHAYLLLFYLSLALAVLAKGPVAVFLAGVIILAFCAVGRDYSLLWRTLSVSGILLFLAVALPWYLAVQLRNRDFFRVFILQHNLARFNTDVFHHQEPFWYFLPVVLLALAPWMIFVAQALLETGRRWREKGKSIIRFEDGWSIFLLLWLVLPVAFFSLSHSKLPGYILPALPAGTLLVADYTRRHITLGTPPGLPVVVLHSIFAALPLIPALSIQYIVLQRHIPWGRTPALIAIVMAVVLAAGIFATLRSHLGLAMLRFVTLVPVVLTLAAILKIGGATIDESFSVRPLAAEIARVEAGNLPTAVFRVSRETEYGLSFYRNQPIANYARGEVPFRDHLLVTSAGTAPMVVRAFPNRRVSFLGNFPPQHLEYYWVSAPTAQPTH
jgi:4-amino-4-deoxy-L-arabinose transferase-like glycosyltransferase